MQGQNRRQDAGASKEGRNAGRSEPRPYERMAYGERKNKGVPG
jgi:hypothetical protein